MDHFSLLGISHYSQYYSSREGSSQVIDMEVPEEPEFYIIGIPEDIGVRANLGRGGAANAFDAFLKIFLSMPAIDVFFRVGKIDFSDIEKEGSEDQLRRLTEEVDVRVERIAYQIFEQKKKVIFIGGGHNNCYGIIKGLNQAAGKSVDVLNIDAHTDLRPMEGRHSGNGFRYAREEGALKRYSMLGLHKHSLTRDMEEFRKDHKKDVKWITLEEWRKKEKKPYGKLIKDFRKPQGIEFDMDVIAGMPSSARHPEGFSFSEARDILGRYAKRMDWDYIHLCEAAPANEEQERYTGKALTTLVLDILQP